MGRHLCQGRGQRNRLKIAAIRKSRCIDIGYRVRNIHRRQAFTVFEAIFSNTGQTFRQGQIPQVGTALERIIANGQDIILHDDGPQSGLVFEYIGTDCHNGMTINALGDGQGGGIAGIAGDGGIAVIIQAVAVGHHRLTGLIIAGAVVAAAPVTAPVGGFRGGIVVVVGVRTAVT